MTSEDKTDAIEVIVKMAEKLKEAQEPTDDLLDTLSTKLKSIKEERVGNKAYDKKLSFYGKQAKERKEAYANMRRAQDASAKKLTEKEVDKKAEEMVKGNISKADFANHVRKAMNGYDRYAAHVDKEADVKRDNDAKATDRPKIKIKGDGDRAKALVQKAVKQQETLNTLDQYTLYSSDALLNSLYGHKDLGPAQFVKNRARSLANQAESLLKLLDTYPELDTRKMLQSKKGKKIKLYTDISEAVKDGFTEKGITNCLDGKNKTHRGFAWDIIEVSPLQAS